MARSSYAADKAATLADCWGCDNLHTGKGQCTCHGHRKGRNRVARRKAKQELRQLEG